MMALTLSRVYSLTKGESLITRDTVFFDTFARRAMSLMVERLRLRSVEDGGVGVLRESDDLVREFTTSAGPNSTRRFVSAAHHTGFAAFAHRRRTAGPYRSGRRG